MSREIKFRARSIEDNKTWFDGHYYIEYGSMPHPIRTKDSLPPAIDDTHWIVFPSFADWGMPRETQRVQVDPKTVRQYTGLKDSEGTEVYEGDLLELQHKTTYPLEVYWDDRANAWHMRFNGEMQYDKTQALMFAKFGKIIGNIYEA